MKRFFYDHFFKKAQNLPGPPSDTPSGSPKLVWTTKPIGFWTPEPAWDHQANRVLDSRTCLARRAKQVIDIRPPN